MMLLMEYDWSVVEKVCHPTRGIATKTTFPPSISELKEALEHESRALPGPDGMVRVPVKRHPSPQGLTYSELEALKVPKERELENNSLAATAALRAILERQGKDRSVVRERDPNLDQGS